jgi:hypothetical protein
VLSDLFVIESKLSLDWPDTGMLDLVAGGVQLATAIVLLAGSCLPRGGTIALSLEPAVTGALLTIKATGIGVRFNDELRLALSGQGAPDHKTIHAHFCAWSAANLGCVVTGTATGDAVLLSALLPFAAEG